MKETEGKPNADCQSRSPMSSTSAEPSSSPWGQARPMGAGEAGGGRRGWWGQARPMGTASHRPHARACQHRTLGKPPGQIPGQHSPFGPRLSRRIISKETNESLRSSLEFQIPLNPNPKKFQAYSVSPNEIQIHNLKPRKSKSLSPARDPIQDQCPPQIRRV